MTNNKRYVERERFIPPCQPGVECSDDEIEDLISEAMDIEEDIVAGIIKEYDRPSDEQLQEIISVAENYSGKWYHSEVVLPPAGETKDNQFVKRLEELGAEKGIVLLYHSSGLSELEK